MARGTLSIQPQWTKQFLSWDEVPVLFYTDTASILLHKAEDTVRQLCQEGKIPAKRIGRQWVFEKDTFRSFYGNVQPERGD